MARRVIVVGAGVTGLATAFRLHRGGAEVVVLESASRAGGLLASERSGPWLVERAANGFLDDGGGTGALARDLDLDVIAAAPASRERFVVHRGRLVAAPASPPGILTTRLLTARAKWRLLRERAVPPRRDGADESLADFARRRLGPGTLHLVDAMATGVHAGDPERLSARHAFPALPALEREHGSLLGGLRRRPRRARPVLSSFAGGTEDLSRALAAALPADAVRLGAAAGAVRAAKNALTVETAAETMEADAVVLAVPPRAAAPILGEPVPAPREAPVAVVALGYRREDAPGARGFGFLAPHAEDRFALGAVFESNLFPGRAPDGHVLVRALVGGVRRPERAALDDAALVEGVRRELADLGVAGGEPVFARIARAGAIPQLDVGHDAVVAAAARAEARMPGLAVAGLGWRAVAVNALVAEADAVARRILGNA